MERSNKKNMWKILTLSASMFFAVSFTACQVGTTGYGYSDWDANDNELIDRNEFGTNLTERYDEWDLNDDSYLDTNEFSSFYDNTEYYSDWDLNEDSYLDENEFSDGLFSEWDMNDDGYLDATEYDENYDTFFGV